MAVVTGVSQRNSSIFSSCNEKIYAIAKPVIQWMLNKSFYAGYKELNPTLAAKRRQALFADYRAEELRCTNEAGVAIDAVYIPSNSEQPTGNVLVICLNTTYQDHHPRHWLPFLGNGADVVVWNPTQLGSVSYSADLSAVLGALRARDADQVIAVKTYCGSTDPGIAAIAEQDDENMHIIIDRGHGNVRKLARSFTVVAKVPLVDRVLREEYDCKGVEKIQGLQGRMLFLRPDKVDQVMGYGRAKNLTRDLQALRPEEPFALMENYDHWSDWDHEIYNKGLRFLADICVVQEDYTPVQEEEFPSPQPPGCWQTRGIPFLTKSYF